VHVIVLIETKKNKHRTLKRTIVIDRFTKEQKFEENLLISFPLQFILLYLLQFSFAPLFFALTPLCVPLLALHLHQKPSSMRMRTPCFLAGLTYFRPRLPAGRGRGDLLRGGVFHEGEGGAKQVVLMRRSRRVRASVRPEERPAAFG